MRILYSLSSYTKISKVHYMKGLAILKSLKYTILKRKGSIF